MRAASQFDHPNALHILNVGIDPSADYVISESITGETLRSLIDRRGLGPDAEVPVVGEIDEATAAARSAGVEHIDLSPDDIVIDRTGRVTLLGLGVGALKSAGASFADDLAPISAIAEALREPPAVTAPRPRLPGLAPVAAGVLAMLALTPVVAIPRPEARVVNTSTERRPERQASDAAAPARNAPAEDAGPTFAPDPPDPSGSGSTGAESTAAQTSPTGAVRVQAAEVRDRFAGSRIPDPRSPTPTERASSPVADRGDLPPEGSRLARPPDFPAAATAPAAPSAASALTPSGEKPAAPQVSSDRDTATLVTEASVRATEFDLPAASSLLRAAAARGEPDAQVAALYAQGLVDAREAARLGGTADSLAPVRAAIASLAAISKGRPGTAEIARLMLHAAAAAAQSEREEMRLYIESATRMEAIQLAAGMSGAPLVTASETAGDLWLLVHRYDEARQAYDEAGERLGSTLRILAGRARAARGANNVPGACEAYRSLLDAWAARPGLPVEIAEARVYSSGFCTSQTR